MANVIPEIKSVLSADSSIDDLINYTPSEPDNFLAYIRFIIGPKGESGEESFDIQVRSPKWLAQHIKPDEVLVGRHYLILQRYDYELIVSFVEQYCSRIICNSWNEVGEKLARLGQWEFEDYREHI